MKKKIISLFLVAALLCGAALSAGCGEQGQSNDSKTAQGAIHFTDDDGREINLDAPCEKIISLYSAHTENLYALGVGDKIIGVHKTSTYPADAATKDLYDYNADPEKVIAAEPDLVLIRPFITRKAPDFVKAIEEAGIPVVSLYPESLDAFPEYIEKLGMVTGTEGAAKEKLAEFDANIAAIQELTAGVENKQHIFFESTDVNLRTVTSDSMAGKAIELAGGINVAADAKPIEEGSSIAPFGEEKVLSLANEIDVYVSQRGAMNAGGNVHAISIRPGFETIKAVKDGRVFVINEKIISSPTFRYYKGVKELARYMYPDLMDSVADYQKEDPANRRDLANLVVRSAHLPIYLPSSSKYYDSEHKGHTYGWFEDVTWEDPDYDYIETAVMAGAIDGTKDGDKESYHPEDPVTREQLAKAVFMLADFKAQDSHKTIADLDSCEKPAMIQNLVDNGVFELNGGKFEPDRQVSQAEIVKALSALPN